jgi:hypothetical protein
MYARIVVNADESLLQGFANQIVTASPEHKTHFTSAVRRLGHTLPPANRQAASHPTGTLRLLPAEGAPLNGWHNPTPTIASTQEVEYNSPAPLHYGVGRPAHIEALHMLTQQAQAAKGALPRLTYPQITHAQATSFYSNPEPAQRSQAAPTVSVFPAHVPETEIPLSTSTDDEPSVTVPLSFLTELEL